jgi:hypothetical protein
LHLAVWFSFSFKVCQQSLFSCSILAFLHTATPFLKAYLAGVPLAYLVGILTFNFGACYAVESFSQRLE